MTRPVSREMLAPLSAGWPDLLTYCVTRPRARSGSVGRVRKATQPASWRIITTKFWLDETNQSLLIYGAYGLYAAISVCKTRFYVCLHLSQTQYTVVIENKTISWQCQSS